MSSGLVSDESVVVNLNFSSGNITIDGEKFNEILARYAKDSHEHSMSDITGLNARLVALESKKCIEKDGDGATLLGTFRCEDLEFRYVSTYVTLSDIIYSLQNPSMTIEHLTLTKDKNIKVGYPVFTGDLLLNREFNVNNLTSRDCIPSVQSTGEPNTFLGICTEVDAEFMGTTTKFINACKFVFVKYASHGDFQMHVPSTSQLKVGDTIDYEGNKIDDETPITVGLKKRIVGTVTGILGGDRIAVFRN